MAEAVLKGALGNLCSLAGTEMGIHLGFNQAKKRFDSMFVAIKATLQDAEEKQFSDRSVKDWLGKLKDAAHELDDIFDECAYEELRLEYEEVRCCLSEMVLSSSLLSSFHPMHLVFRYKIANRMKSMSERLDEIAQEREQLHLTQTVQERTSRDTDWRQTFSSISEPLVYGREEDTKRILDFLICDTDASYSEDVSVYPIVGLGGLGKTTLAQLVFNHEEVVKDFGPRIWVCVSEDFSLKRMTKAIIEAASRHTCEDLALELLHEKLQDLLKEKRYLLVLDDVWDYKPDNWQRLKSILACGAKGSSILVTTRLSKVAEIMGTVKYPHELSVLPDNDCWELFKHEAFGPYEVEQVELEYIGKEIVNKCQGVPLAAKALGGLLRFKRRKNEWLSVRESNLLEVSQEENSIMPALRLSYLNLPIELRLCFAYCAIFPKDEKIEKQYLIDLWMANGFISSNEDDGDDVWNELYCRSFFQDIEIDEFGKVKSFKMHDLVHDLAQSVAEDVCCITEYNDDETVLSKRIHHLSDHRWRSNSIPLHQVKSLRTYLRPHHYDYKLSHDVLRCYSLRVLHWNAKAELSSSIGDLKLLRYLNLSRGKFETLPESLCKLWSLQILKLDYCDHLQNLPNSLTCLKALQQLSLYRCLSLKALPPWIGKLTSLRSLTTYFVGKESGFHLAELGQLKLKGDICIMCLRNVKSVIDAKEANMSSKQLNQLDLSWYENEESELEEESKLEESKLQEQILEVLQPDTQQLQHLRVGGYKGAHFPQWMFSPSLKLLEISSCTVVKGLHEALQHMTSLHSLRLHNIPNLESLPDCFRNLRELTIRHCGKLKCLPTSLSSLQILTIVNCSKLEQRCEKVTGEDWPKIAHVPKIQVRKRR